MKSCLIHSVDQLAIETWAQEMNGGAESWTVPPPWKLYFNPWLQPDVCVCRFQEAWSLCESLQSADCWQQLATAALQCLDIDFGQLFTLVHFDSENYYQLFLVTARCHVPLSPWSMQPFFDECTLAGLWECNNVRG